jgi:hypothetical protein
MLISTMAHQAIRFRNNIVFLIQTSEMANSAPSPEPNLVKNRTKRKLPNTNYAEPSSSSSSGNKEV